LPDGRTVALSRPGPSGEPLRNLTACLCRSLVSSLTARDVKQQRSAFHDTRGSFLDGQPVPAFSGRHGEPIGPSEVLQASVEGIAADVRQGSPQRNQRDEVVRAGFLVEPVEGGGEASSEVGRRRGRAPGADICTPPGRPGGDRRRDGPALVDQQRSQAGPVRGRQPGQGSGEGLDGQRRRSGFRLAGASSGASVRDS